MLRLQIWLAHRWVSAAGFMAAASLAIAPLAAFQVVLLLIFLHSPTYMLHQIEEHTSDRFRTFVNERVFGGHDALTVPAVLIINLPLVWGVNLVALYVAYFSNAAWGLVAPYLMLMNGIAHVATSFRFRVYNPGLVTSLVLFLPLSITTIWKVGLSDGFAPQIVGALLSIIIHAAIVVAIYRRFRSQTNSAPTSRQRPNA